MGSPPTEAGREDDETQHKKRIGRTFALAAKAVTVEQYRQFDDGYQLPASVHPHGGLAGGGNDVVSGGGVLQLVEQGRGD